MRWASSSASTGTALSQAPVAETDDQAPASRTGENLVTDPMVNSEQDLRCPIEQGEHLFTLLRLMGRYLA